ncbi:MAG: YqgE/AlgH family protein [Flavobacteriales bacterium]|nr:YqgE/AlgH family protein [Flavobacteriales bacterium]MCB9448152.1 YqgE/AlgH family protein [Flavobacteriales bacterium]
MDKLEPKIGRLLLSEPFLTDLHFKRSVILLTEHNEGGSLGFVLNKPISLTINEAVDDFPTFDSNLYLGGPVRNDSLYFIHTFGDKIEGSIHIKKGLYWGGNFEQLKDYALTGQIQPHQVRFFIGYSGWGPQQLENELGHQSWVVANGRVKQIMQEPTTTLWKDLLSGMGNEYAILSNFPDNPSMN